MGGNGINCIPVCYGTQNVTGFNKFVIMSERIWGCGDICGAGIVCPWYGVGVVMVM